jgi:DNA polymerase III sliding clamp (beta) subunit (PCNA family)
MPAPSIVRTLENLRFVKGAVAKKDFAPVLTHFKIHENRVTGYNGSLAISSPVDLNISCYPKAIQFIKAIQTCEETIAINLTQGKKLAIRSGPYKAFVDCMPENDEYPIVLPEGDTIVVNGNMLLEAFRTVEPFVAEDASKPWARGVLLNGQSCFATNNIILVEKWLGVDLPPVNVPVEAVTEISRINLPPIQIQISDRSITFHFSDERWIRSQLLPPDWPNVARILEQDADQAIIPKGFWKALEAIRPFCSEQGAVILTKDCLSTHGKKGIDEGIGSYMDVIGVPEIGEGKGGFNLTQLQLLESVVLTMGWRWPEPCIFYGNKLRGAFIGMVIV